METPTILVVEDTLSEQFALKKVLEKLDYEVHLVSSGEDALSALARHHYMAVLMDICLPGMDGMQCTRQIRLSELGSNRRTPIIAVTVGINPSDHSDCLAAGMDDFITKPFDPNMLRRMLLRYVYDPSQPNLKILTPLDNDDLESVGLENELETKVLQTGAIQAEALKTEATQAEALDTGTMQSEILQTEGFQTEGFQTEALKTDDLDV